MTLPGDQTTLIQQRAQSLFEMGLLTYRGGDVTGALRVFEQVLMLMEETGDLRGRSVTLGTMAEILSQQGAGSQAIRLWEQVLPLLNKIGDKPGRAATLDKMAHAWDRVGDRARALELWQQALAGFEEVGAGQDQVAVLVAMAEAAASLGEARRAGAWCEQGLALAEELGDERGKAFTLRTMANLLEQQGDAARAVVVLQQALEIFQRQGDADQMDCVLMDLAAVSFRQGDFVRAVEVWARLLEALERYRDADEGKASILYMMAGATACAADVPRALALWRQALEIEERMRDAQGQASARSIMNAKVIAGRYISDALARQDVGSHAARLRRAIEVREQMLAPLEGLGDMTGKAVTLDHMASAWAQLGDRSRALDVWQQALAAYAQIGDDGAQVRVLDAMVALAVSQGETARAIALCEEQLALLAKLGDTPRKAVTLRVLAKLLKTQGDIERVIESLQEALEILERLGDTEELRGIRIELGMLSFEHEDFSRALACWTPMIESREWRGDFDMKAGIRYLMAAAAAHTADIPRALELWRQAVEIEGHLEDADRQATTFHTTTKVKSIAGQHVAMVLSRQGVDSQDIGLLQQSVDILDSIGELRGKAILHSGLALALVRQGEGDRALELMQQAVEILDSLGEVQDKAMALSNTAGTLLQMGNWHAARKSCEQALELQEQIGDERGRALTLVHMQRCVALEEEERTRARLHHEQLFQLSKKDGTAGRVLNAARLAAQWRARLEPHRESAPKLREAPAEQRVSLLSATNEVRVFLCSTFLDFELERRLMHEEVVPPLQEVCAHYGLRFSLSDLRYGVTERDATAARTNELCLMEVSHCARISPELHCVCLLGDRYGSRVVPRELDTRGLQSLLSSLDPVSPAHARVRELLGQIYDLKRAGSRARSLDGNRDATERFLRDPEITAVLQSISTMDSAGEAVRSALGFSVTHQELLHAGALSGAQGVVTVLRSMVRVPSGGDAALLPAPRWSDRFMDEGPTRAAQERLRESAAANTSAMVLTLEMPVTSDDRILKEYTDRFRSTVLPPLHERILSARGRGTRSHRFLGLSRPVPSDAGAVFDEPESRQLDHWIDDPSAGPLAVVAEAGAFRATLLARLESSARRRGIARTIRLDATARPELGDFRNFTLAVLAALGDIPDDESVTGLENVTPFDVGPRLIDAVRRAAASGPLLLIVNGIDLVRTDGLSSLHPLWREMPGLRFACGCEAGYALLATYAQRCRVIATLDRAPEDCERFLATVIEQGGLRLPAADLAAMVHAASARPTPEYLSALADAYVSSEGDAEAGWNRALPEQFHEGRLQYLVRKAPFSPEVCHTFLGLAAAGSLGVAEEDFLQVAAHWPAVHQSLVASFAAPPFGREVPALVWHRLRVHFEDILEGVGLFDDVTVRPRAAERATLFKLVGSDLARECTLRLTEHLWSKRESPPARVVLQLPGLLARGGDPQRLGLLFQTKGFTKPAIKLDNGRNLIEAWRSQKGLEDVSPVVVDTLPASSASSVEDTTHWLLDLAILLRALGQAAESAKAAHRALDLRSQTLAAGNALIVTAALQASDSYLEAGDFQKAQGIAEDVLRQVSADAADSPLVRRLRHNLASAYGYQGQHEKAVPILLQQTTAVGEHWGARDMAAVHGGLASAYAELGELDKALEHSNRCIDLTILTLGENADRLALSLANRGSIFLARREPREAAACFERALGIYDRQMDRDHPWRVNAAMHAVDAFVDAGETERALDRLVIEVSDTTVAMFAVWSEVAVPLVLDGIHGAATAAVDVLRKLAASLHSELQAGEVPVPRALDKFSAFTLARMDGDGQQMSRPEGRQAHVLLGICRWLLAYAEATARGLFPREDTVAFLRDVDRFLSEKLLRPASLLALESRTSFVWSHIKTRADQENRQELFRSLVAEATGAAARMMGKVELSETALAQSITTLELQLAAVRARQPVDENEAGQLCILLSTKYAAAERFDEAISCQKEAVAIAERLFGKQSRNHWNAVINLGSVLRGAGRTAEAFTHYHAGLREIVAFEDGSAEKMWGALERAMDLGFQAKEFAAVGELLEVFDSHFSDPRMGVNLSLAAIGAWVNAGRVDLGTQKFQRAAAILARVKTDLADWLTAAMAPMAIRLMSLDLTDPQKRELYQAIAALRQMAREHKLVEDLEANESWIMLMQMLDTQEGLAHD